MDDIVIIGVGQLPLGEHWDLGLRNLGTRAMLAAMEDAGGMKPDAVYIGTYLASMVSHQSNLGALLTDHAALRGVEAYTVEAAEASGAGALRMAYLAVQSGFVDSALAVGVDKFTDQVGTEINDSIQQSMDYDFEGMHGMLPVTQAALMMQRYLYDHQLPNDALAAFPILAHRNAVGNPNAMYQREISIEAYRRSSILSAPVNLFDMAPYADGAAAVMITRSSLVPENLPHSPIRITGSANVIDRLAPHDRPLPTAFEAVPRSIQQACGQAGILPEDVDFFELHDSFSIYTALILEAAGLCEPGQSGLRAAEGMFDRGGKLPISTMGGMKARGNALGASGMYQAVEACLQLRGEAGHSQLDHPRRGMIQAMGGPAATVITHILEK